MVLTGTRVQIKDRNFFSRGTRNKVPGKNSYEWITVRDSDWKIGAPTGVADARAFHVGTTANTP